VERKVERRGGEERRRGGEEEIETNIKTKSIIVNNEAGSSGISCLLWRRRLRFTLQLTTTFDLLTYIYIY